MRQAFIILSAVIALLASAKTNTTRPVAGISEKTLLMKTINAENDTASFADKIILSGYKKTVNDAFESFFVDNQTPFLISHLTLKFQYTNALTGQIIKEATYEVQCDIPSGQMRQLSIRTFDKQHSFYYANSRKPNRPATPYSISYKLMAYDIRITVEK